MMTEKKEKMERAGRRSSVGWMDGWMVVATAAAAAGLAVVVGSRTGSCVSPSQCDVACLLRHVFPSSMMAKLKFNIGYLSPHLLRTR